MWLYLHFCQDNNESSFLIDIFHSSWLCCGDQNSTSFTSLETEDEDEGSIFYANSTRLAVQVSFILILSLLYPEPHLCCVVCTYTWQSICVLGWWQQDCWVKCFCTNSSFMPNNSWCGYCAQSVWCIDMFVWRPVAFSCIWQVSQESRQVMTTTCNHQNLEIIFAAFC